MLNRTLAGLALLLAVLAAADGMNRPQRTQRAQRNGEDNNMMLQSSRSSVPSVVSSAVHAAEKIPIPDATIRLERWSSVDGPPRRWDKARGAELDGLLCEPGR